MAHSTTFTSAASDIEKVYKKTTGKLYPAFKTMTEEYEWHDDISDEEIEISAREMLIKVDVAKGYGAAMIPEAGYEARTVSQDLEDAVLTWVNMNQRFSISLTAKALDQKARGAQVHRQVVHQSVKAVESMARLVGRQFYGLSTGVVAVNQTNATATSGQAYTIADAFNQSGIDDAAYLASLFEVGQGVALIRSDALVTNAIGTVTAVSAATPSITVTWAGSVDADVGDLIVYANAVTDATITATDYNRWPVGLLDACTSTSVHSLSSASFPLWDVGFEDTTGGRLSFVRLKSLRQGIFNNGDGKLTDVIWANGVENDVEAGERAALRYASSMSMDLDAKVRSKGVQFRTSALVPPGLCFGYDKSAFGKFSLHDKPAKEGAVDWASMDKAENRNALLASIDFSYARVVRSRAKIGYLSGLTEQ